MTAPRKGRRQLARLVGELSERDRQILASVASLRLVSATQLERLHFVVGEQHASALSAARSCRRTLERLTRDRLLLRLERRVGGVRAGSASFVYAIGPVGERVIGRDGARRRHREPSSLFVAHTLAVAELYVRLHEAERAGLLKLSTPILIEPACWRRLGGFGPSQWLKPDLAVVLMANDFEYRWLVEVDLGTEHRPAIVRKCQTYEAYYRSGVEQERYGVFPRVLWVVPDGQRLQGVRQAIENTSGLSDGLFVVVVNAEAVAVLAGGSS